MYNQGEIKGFCPKSCYLCERNTITSAVFAYGTVPEPRAQIVELFLVFTYIWQEDIAKISKEPEAPRNVNPARK